MKGEERKKAEMEKKNKRKREKESPLVYLVIGRSFCPGKNDDGKSA